jgi:two-component system, cell cycle sensor histidine kinase and response regulator CckA
MDLGHSAREGDERFRLITETINEVFWMAAHDLSRMVYVSPAYERIWGRTCESVYREPRSFLEAIHPDDLDRVLGDLERQKPQHPFDHEYRIVRPDGSLRWIWDRGYPVRDDSGEVLHYVGVAEDITERKRAETELATMAERLRLVARATNDGLWDWDMVTNTAWWSDTYYETFGYDRGTSPSFEAWESRIHPEDRDRILADFARAIERGDKTWAYEYRFLTADGSVRDVFDRAYLLYGPTGQPIRMLGAMMDITERKRAETALRVSEERFRATFEQAAVGVAHVGLDGRFLRVNQKLCDITGFDRTKLTTLSLRDIRHPGDGEADRFETDLLLSGEIETCTTQMRYLRKGGEIVWVEVTMSLVRGAVGAPDYMMAVIVDIGDRLTLESQLRHAQKMDAIGALAGGIAHDFNNILQAIILETDVVLMTDDLATPSTSHVRDIKALAERAASLTSQLLVFSRADGMQRQDLDINGAVVNLSKLLQRTLGEDVHLELDLDALAGRVFADPSMVDQVLMNLAINARDAMPRGGTLTIASAPFVHGPSEPRSNPNAVLGGRYVCLTVGDTGSGIPSDLLPRIFEPFFTTKEPGRGTGLGLATVFGIVERHGGWIEVESELERGTRFRVFLPTHHGPHGRKHPTRPSGRLGSENILLVEDDASVRRAMRAILERNGYHILEATSGAEALRRWDEANGQIDLVLTDLMMPGGMDGSELVARLVTQQPEVRVVYASGYSRDFASRNLRLRRRERFLAKPVTSDRLLSEVRACLDD